jgi:crotonobetainyl-CoA:carnitine CoA-transferase CaiB-like acyl-CoA transferase
MSAQPLAGVTVVDLTRYLPGPLAAKLLADLGARVLKVEEPQMGDPVRLAPPIKKGKSSLATLLLSGVESLCLDLKRAEARRVLEHLLEGADVLLETFRPGALARMGLGPTRLRRRFPRLVIGSISGWGQDGPYANRSGHDLTYQAIAGTLANGERMPHQPVADLLGAWSAVTAVLAALHERHTSGQGAWIDAALFDAAVHANLVGWAAEADGAKALGEPLSLTGALPCYNLYRTAEGTPLALAALEPHFWERFCNAVGRRDLLGEQFSRKAEAKRALAELAAGRTRGQWQALLRAHDLPAELVLSSREAMDHPQTRARGVLRQGGDSLPRIAFPARFDGQRPVAGDHCPGLGEHTAKVLDEWGLLDADLPLFRGRAGIGKRFSVKRLILRLVTRSA